ncbi:MAG: 4-hydroxy-tetrahydrodipicolinate reductase [Candidatus Margulisiibacteriota bacterium]
MITVAIIGAKGKMGTEAVKAVSAAPNMAVVAQIGRGDAVAETLKTTKPQVVVELTHPSSVFDHCTTILESGAHAVVGTTGLTQDQLKTLDALAKERGLGILVCPNFAIGAVLMMKFAAEAARYMPRAEIIEFHHDKKADAPSGTALKTAELMANATPNLNDVVLDEIESIPGARGGIHRNIPIHSVRLPGYIAHQEVLFGGLGQTLSLRHDTISRESFMPGVLLCIQKVSQIKGLVYGMENIL